MNVSPEERYMHINDIIAQFISDHIDEATTDIARILYEENPGIFGELDAESRRKKVSRVRHKRKIFRKESAESQYSERVDGDTAVITKITSDRILTLDDLIRVCGIDTEVWEVDKYEVNSYESQTKLRRYKDGERVDDKHKVVPLFQVKAFLKRNKFKILGTELKKEILDEIKNASPKVLKLKFPKAEHLLEVNIFDLHLGKHAWHEETGEDYDLKIASELFLDCLSDLMKHGLNYGLERILFPVGNDFFNVDNRINTTSNGTPQSEDTRWQKTFRVGRRLIMDGIEALSQKAPVDIIVVPGNHDFERTFYLGEVLEAVYTNNQNVNVNNGANPRKYYQYGDNLIGFTHGKDEKILDLPLIMASEAPDLWAATKYREWHLGHIHHKKEIKWVSIQEQKGATVRFMRSLTPPDGWHHQKGYVGNTRSGEAYVWHRTDGLIGQFTASI